MKKHTVWTALGFMIGMGLGCTTAAVVAQDAQPKAPEVTVTKASVVSMAKADKRVAPSGKAVAHRFVTGERAYVGRLELAGGGAVPEHRDPTEEFIYVLEGTGTITIDGASHDVGPDTAIYMPAGAQVSYQNGPEAMVAIQIFAEPGPEAKYDGWGAQ